MTPIALDTTVGLIILTSAMISYFRGLIKESFTLMGLGLAIFTAYKGGHMLLPGLSKLLNVPSKGSTEKHQLVMGFLSPEMASKVGAYGGTFLITFLIVTLIGFLLSRWVKEMGLGIVDRLLGGCFGAVRGFLLVFVVYAVFTYLTGTQTDPKMLPVWVKDSVSGSMLQGSMTWVKERFELDKKLEDHGNGIAIKLDKIGIDRDDEEKVDEEAKKAAEEELKEAIKREEKEIQKGVDDIQQEAAPDNQSGGTSGAQQNTQPFP